MLRPGGYAVITTPVAFRANLDNFRCEEIGIGTWEADTYDCKHCNRQMHAELRRRDTDYFFCRKCMARICPHCADYPCLPFIQQEERIQAAVERDRALSAYFGR